MAFGTTITTPQTCKKCTKNHQDECAEFYVCDKEHSHFVQRTCGNCREVETKLTPMETRGCGECSIRNGDYTGFIYWQPRPAEIVKSCSVCGHFHAEPYNSWDGYCDIKPYFNSATYGKGKEGVHKKSNCNEFTPRAALEVDCKDCMGFDPKEGGYCNKSKGHIDPNTLSDCDIFERKTPPAACARCGTTDLGENPIHPDSLNPELEMKIVVCTKCRNSAGGYHDYKMMKDSETAAERPWWIDRKQEGSIKIERNPTDYIQWGIVKEGEKITPGSPVRMEDFKTPAAAPVKVKLCAFGKEWTADCHHKPCLSCKKTGIKMESDAKMAFKCQQCQYEDETRKKVKYCPACGVGVEENISIKSRGGEKITEVTLRRKLEEARTENAALAQENNTLRRDRDMWKRSDADQTQKVINLTKENESAWKISNERLDLIEKLQQKGIPWKCRRCIKKGYQSLENWPCVHYYEGKCQYSTPKVDSPAPLWKTKLTNKILNHKVKRLERKAEKERRRGNTETANEYLRNKIKQLEGAA